MTSKPITQDNVEHELGQPIHCKHCGCVSSTVRRDHDNVARCDVCYRDEYPNEISYLGEGWSADPDWQGA